MTKYELVNYDFATGLYRIRALRDFADVKSGDIGGWMIEIGGHSSINGNVQVTNNEF